MKERWPLEEAQKVAESLLLRMASSCIRIEIAGSLRRRRPDVGDIEILFISKEERVKDVDLFTDTLVRTADICILGLEGQRVLARRKNANGSEVYGEKNKLMVHVDSGIPVDLFATTLGCWFNYLVFRTGPAESNIRIASKAKKQGWTWNPYGPGFTTTHRMPPELIPVHCEEDVFRLVGLPYLPPEERK